MTTSMKWLRLYNEARTDAKLESLPDDEFRVWHRLLCFASEQPNRGVIAGFTPRLLAVEVARGDVALLERTLTSLQELRIIVAGDDDAYAFTKWESRQYDKPSDTPERVAERVAAHRDRQRNTAVTPSNTLVTPSNAIEEEAEEEEDPDPERETEEETPSSPAVEDGALPRARARKAARAVTTTSSGDPVQPPAATVIDLCQRIAKRTKLPQRTEVLEQLSDVITSHIARGLSPGDIWLDVLNLTDPSRPKHATRPTVSQISNWLAHTHPAVNYHDTTDTQTERENQHGHNGHSGHNGHTTRRPLVAAVAGSGRWRAAIIPDPTADGPYAHLVTVASDDDPDEA